MSSSLKKRIECLEQQDAADGAASELNLLVSFHAAAPGDQLAASQITDGAGGRWVRTDGESEATFLERAKAEAKKVTRGSLKVLFAASGEKAGTEHR